jgi:hypothetical protein
MDDFWKSAVGSELTLELVKPPDSELTALRVKYCNAYPKKVYEVTFLFSSGEVDTSYHSQRKTEKIIEKQWLVFYRDRTQMHFLKHREVDMSTLVSPRSGSTSESEDVYSPKTWLHRHLSLPLSRRSDSSTDDFSSREASPRNWLGGRLSLSLSRETSPRDYGKSPRAVRSPRRALSPLQQQHSPRVSPTPKVEISSPKVEISSPKVEISSPKVEISSPSSLRPNITKRRNAMSSSNFDFPK